MLPASDLTEILANLSALNLQPTAAAQILAAVLAPLLRNSDPDPPEDLLPHKRARRQPQRPRRTRSRSALRQKRRYTRHHLGPGEPRQRAIAALKENSDATNVEIAKRLKVSPSTIHHARRDLAKEARKEARKQARASAAAKPPDPRERAQQFLREQLARGPKQASAVEAAAEKAHVALSALEQARADLHVVVGRGNAAGVQAVQWSLPG